MREGGREGGRERASERERESKRVCVCVRERECVCVCKRERGGERETWCTNSWICVSVSAMSCLYDSRKET